MTIGTSPDATPAPDPVAARRRFRRVVVQVFAVQIVSLVALWLLHVAYGTP